MALQTQSGTRGVLLIVAFVMVLVGGILASVAALRLLRYDNGDAEYLAVLILGIVAIVGAIIIWTGPSDTGSILGIVAAIVFLILFPQTAGILALLGGILGLIAPRLGPMSGV